MANLFINIDFIYRQKYDPNKSQISLRQNQHDKFHSILRDYRALGWKESTVSEIRK